MFLLNRGLDIHNIGGLNPDTAGLRTNLSITGSVATGIKSVIGVDGFVHLKTYNNDATQPVIDYSDIRTQTDFDEFRFYEKQDATKQSNIWVKWTAGSVSANYYVTGFYDNYGAWPQNTWVRLLAKHTTNPVGMCIDVYADSFVGAANFSLQFGLGNSATEAAISPTPLYNFRVVGYAS